MKVKGQSQPEIAAAAFLILEPWFGVDHFNPGFDYASGTLTISFMEPFDVLDPVPFKGTWSNQDPNVRRRVNWWEGNLGWRFGLVAWI